ncbi:MAG TPA: hydroxymethylbilane synthase [Chloroflexota bacterium]
MLYPLSYGRVQADYSNPAHGKQKLASPFVIIEPTWIDRHFLPREEAIRPLVVGTRGSSLALIQTNRVVDALQQRRPAQEFLVHTIQTLGDRRHDVPLREFGKTGIFVKEIDRLLLDGAIDLAVHSLKDVPPDEPPELVLAAFPERADPRDAIVSRNGETFAELPPGARVGTSSTRRQAQLRALRSDLVFRDDLRGNVDTRIHKLRQGQYDAIVLAAAGLDRLGRGTEIAERLAVEDCLPDAGQGSLVVQTRADDHEVRELVATIDDPAVRAVSLAERAVLDAFGGGCKVPVAAYAELQGRELDLRGLVATVDGTRIVRARQRGSIDRPVELGQALWRELVAAGAGEILAVASRG